MPRKRLKKEVRGGRAVIYARYSSHNQREVSIDQQVAACRKRAKELGLVVVDSYEDKAVSGKTDRRPAFQRLMHDAEKAKFDFVLAWKSNRIGRNMMQALVNEAKLEECGVKVYYAEEDFDDSAAGRFALRSMMNVNQFYSENMAEDILRGLYDNASKCIYNGLPPLGYKKDSDGRLVVDEPAAAIVREIYSRVAAYESFASIKDDLNARGIKTRGGGMWNKGSFRTLCRNEKYRGIYIYGDVRIPGGIPQLIPDDLWYKVQEVCTMKKNPQDARHRKGAEDYLLTGKLRCGHCGSYMTGISGTSASGELHYYYTCQKRRTRKGCDKKPVRRDVIEAAVAQAIKMYCLSDEVIGWIADRAVEYWDNKDRELHVESIEAELAAGKKSIGNVMKAIEAGIITETTRDRLHELEQEQHRLEEELRCAKACLVHIDRDDLVATLEMYRSGDIRDKKFQAELFRTFLTAVYLYDDNRLKIIFSFDKNRNEVETTLQDIDDLTPKSCSFLGSGAPYRSTSREIVGCFFI